MTIRYIIPITLLTIVAACSRKDKAVAPPAGETKEFYTAGGCTTTFEPPTWDTLSLNYKNLLLLDAEMDSVHSGDCIFNPPLPPPSDEIVCVFPCEPIPEFPGGEKALYDFLEKNIQYPEKAFREKKSGVVFVKFVVQEDGKLSGFETICRSPGFGMEEEALRVMKMMPDWKPFTQNGKPTVARMHLPIRFSMTDEKK